MDAKHDKSDERRPANYCIILLQSIMKLHTEHAVV